MKKTSLKIGALGGTIALLCCISPIVLVLLGLSSATAALALGNTLFAHYKLYFISASILFMAGAIAYYLKKKNQCSLSGVRKNLNMILLTFCVAVVVYIFWYFFTSWLGTLA